MKDQELPHLRYTLVFLPKTENWACLVPFIENRITDFGQVENAVLS